MVIDFNPNINYKVIFAGDMTVTSSTNPTPSNILTNTADSVVKTIPIETNQSVKPENTENKTNTNAVKSDENNIDKKVKEDIVKQTYSKWVGLSGMGKGITKGLIAGFFAGTAVAACDIIISVFKNPLNAFKETFKPMKLRSKTGKILAPAVAAFIFIENIIVAKLKINKKRAEV